MKSMIEYWVTTSLGPDEPWGVMMRAKTSSTAARMAKSWSRRDGCKYRILRVELVDEIKEKRKKS